MSCYMLELDGFWNFMSHTTVWGGLASPKGLVVATVVLEAAAHLKQGPSASNHQQQQLRVARHDKLVLIMHLP